jgi:hypothetical protein
MPCTMVCLTPVIIGAWPAIATCAAAVASALGFAGVSCAAREKVEVEEGVTEVEVEVDSVLEGCTGEEQEFVKGGVRLVVRTNEDGRLVVRASGDESKESLQQKALTFAGRLQQAYSYDKAMTQLRQSGFNVTDEHVGQDQDVHVTLRRW